MDIIPRESCESQYMFYEFLFFQTSSVSCEDCSFAFRSWPKDRDVEQKPQKIHVDIIIIREK